MAFFHRTLRNCRLSVDGRMVPVDDKGRLEGEFSPEEVEWLVRMGQFTEVSEPKAEKKPAPSKEEGAGTPAPKKSVAKKPAAKKPAAKKPAAKKKASAKKSGK
jgi:DNA topoisomerase-1